MNFIAKHLPDKFYLENEVRLSLRDTIFREIVVNLLIHREYTNANPATLIIYDDRVETQNANKPHFYGELRPGSFVPFPKNPTIAKFFAQMGRAEELGTGVYKVYKYMKAYSGSDRIIFSENDLFRTVLPLRPLTTAGKHAERVGEKVGENLSENQSKVIKAIMQEPRISASKLSKILGISVRKTEENIKKLKDIGLLIRIGPDKGGHWKVVEELRREKELNS
jgi:ATP-dependent DNA helicase RecG